MLDPPPDLDAKNVKMAQALAADMARARRMVADHLARRAAGKRTSAKALSVVRSLGNNYGLPAVELGIERLKFNRVMDAHRELVTEAVSRLRAAAMANDLNTRRDEFREIADALDVIVAAPTAR